MSASSLKTVLITGANSGLGFECALTIAKQGGFRVIVAGRSRERVDAAAAQIEGLAAPNTVVESCIFDLASLEDVKRFARALDERGLELDSIVCNAGVQMKEKTLTKDGFECTIGVNHIAHFQLVELLKHRCKRVVMVTSETHDPAEKDGLPKPKMDDLQQLAMGHTPFVTMQAYTSSKLCNILHMKELVRRSDTDSIEVIAYAPGFMPDTAFFRDSAGMMWFIAKPMMRFLVWLSGGRNSTPQYAGRFLARIATADSLSHHGWTNGDYIRVYEVRQPSEDARNPVLACELWEKSVEWTRAFIPSA